MCISGKIYLKEVHVWKAHDYVRQMLCIKNVHQLVTKYIIYFLKHIFHGNGKFPKIKGKYTIEYIFW